MVRGVSRRRFALGIATTAILIALLLGGTSLVVNEAIERPELIVSLASHEWERLPVAAQVAARFPKAVLILTLPPAVTQHRCHGCPFRVEFLVNLGVRRERVGVLRLTESSTRGEARTVAEFMRRHKLQRVLVVTSAYHTRRALRTFQHELRSDGATVGVIAADEDTWARPRRWWSRPYDRWYVTYEWAALTRDLMRQAVGG
jgi:uncharacterized SAM-binding protein YcdF (DUF218 family)